MPGLLRTLRAALGLFCAMDYLEEAPAGLNVHDGNTIANPLNWRLTLENPEHVLQAEQVPEAYEEEMNGQEEEVGEEGETEEQSSDGHQETDESYEADEETTDESQDADEIAVHAPYKNRAAGRKAADQSKRDYEKITGELEAAHEAIAAANTQSRTLREAADEAARVVEARRLAYVQTQEDAEARRSLQVEAEEQTEFLEEDCRAKQLELDAAKEINANASAYLVSDRKRKYTDELARADKVLEKSYSRADGKSVKMAIGDERLKIA